MRLDLGGKVRDEGFSRLNTTFKLHLVQLVVTNEDLLVGGHLFAVNL